MPRFSIYKVYTIVKKYSKEIYHGSTDRSKE